MSCFKYSFFIRAKTLVLEVLICPREIAPRESRQIQPGDRTHWFSNLVDELLINKPTGRVVPNSSKTCMSQLNYESHDVTCIECYFLQFYNNLTMLRRISNALCAHLLCTSRVAALWAATRIHPCLTRDSKVCGLPIASIISWGRWMQNLQATLELTWTTEAIRVSAGFKHQSSDLVENQVEFLGIFRCLAIAGNATRLPPPSSVSHQASRLPVENGATKKKRIVGVVALKTKAEAPALHSISACKKQTASITSAEQTFPESKKQLQEAKHPLYIRPLCFQQAHVKTQKNSAKFSRANMSLKKQPTAKKQSPCFALNKCM